jgi:hypothetical protein
MTSLMPSTVTYTGGGQTDSPVSSGSLSPSVAAIAMGGTRVFAISAAYQQLQALKQNLTIAKNYYTINKQDFDFWTSTYQNHMRDALLEGMNRPYYTTGTFTPQYGALDYKASTGRGQSKAALKMDRDWYLNRRKISKYNTGLGHKLDLQYSLARFNSELEGFNLGYRFEDNRKLVYDEQRHAHQAEILNLGIGAGNAARKGLATAVGTLSEARSEKASQMGALSNGLSNFAGFMQQTQGIGNSAKKDFKLATAGKNPDFSGYAPDVSKDQMQRAEGSA